METKLLEIEELKNRIASFIINEGNESFQGEQDTACNLLNASLNDDEDINWVAICIYTIAVKKYQENRFFTDALKWLEYALLVKPNYPQAYYRKAEIVGVINGDNLAAISEYDKGLQYLSSQHKPSVYIWGHFDKGLCYARLQQYTEAIKEISLAFDCIKISNQDSPHAHAMYSKKDVEVLLKLISCAKKSGSMADVNKLYLFINNYDQEVIDHHTAHPTTAQGIGDTTLSQNMKIRRFIEWAQKKHS